MTTTKPGNPQALEQMANLAAHLKEWRPAMLDSLRVAAENDRQLSQSSRLSRAAFYDHLPEVLDALDRKLYAWPDADEKRDQGEREAGGQHGRHRWQQGYNLREMMHEWGLFNARLVEELDHFALQQAELSPPVMPAAHLIAARLFGEGISESVTQYQHLLQTEAAGRVADMEQALQQMQSDETERGQSLRIASHDLRGSLALVQGAASMLQEPRLDDEGRRDMARLVQSGVATLNQMLTDLLNLARLEAGQEKREIVAFDVAPLLQSFCESSQPMAKERDLYLRAQGPDSLSVEGDPIKVQRILQNLLLNALKYSQHGGVTVSWQECENDQWSFCVRDTGPGLSEGAMPLSKELMEATDEATEAPDTTAPDENKKSASPAGGEGIGLSIVRRLCALLEATLQVESNAGEGSIFRVILPRRYESD